MSDNLSQEDIDRLLAGLPVERQESNVGADVPGGQAPVLTADEKDALGELGNISMGAAATALSEIISNKVDITTPNILEFHDIMEIIQNQEDAVVVEIQNTAGIESSVLFVLKNHDVAIITDLMMGGTGDVDPATYEIGELQLSAVGEAMNQMMGSAATNLSSMLNRRVDISPPKVTQIVPGQNVPLPPDIQQTPVIGVVFRLTIENHLDSEILQLMSAKAAKHMVQMLMGSIDSMLEEMQSEAPSAASQLDMQTSGMGGFDTSSMHGGPPPHMQQGMPGMQQQYPGMQQGMYQGMNQQMPPPGMQQGMYPGGMPQQNHVTVQPAQFTSFDGMQSTFGMENQNLELVLDVSLKLTVELGRTELPIKSVLELTRGSVIELERIAGEPVDLLANGKLIAKGEVVVIEDNFGLRITSIVSPADRLKNL